MNALARSATTLLLLLLISGCSASPQPQPRVLVFSKTSGYRHASIDNGVRAIVRLGRQHGFAVDATEDGARFSLQELKRYRAIVFLNTTGDVLDEAQQAALEEYVEGGGGYAGIHSASDTEYDWPWYGRLVGAYFASHPEIQPARLHVLDRTHAATLNLPDIWERTDEWYNFHEVPRHVRVLMRIDESSYEGGEHGADHPMAWSHEIGSGRAFYTALGHTDASYEEPLFLEHLLGGIRYAARLAN